MKRSPSRTRWINSFCTVGVLAFTIAASQAQAAPFQLIYQGAFSSLDALNLASDATPTFFSAETPFTLRAWFDTSSPNLLPPSPPAPPIFGGFRAYSASLATIEVSGQTFTIETFDTNPTAGLAVAIFDKTNFFTPNRYGIGILQQPAQDGAGFVGDFSSASPEFTVDSLVSTTFTGYNGVGYGSGVCTSGTPPQCPHEVTPFVLHDNLNQVWALTFGNYEEVYPGGVDAGGGRPVGPLNQAQLVAIPEPGTLGLVSIALIFGFGLARRRRSHPYNRI